MDPIRSWLAPVAIVPALFSAAPGSAQSTDSTVPAIRPGDAAVSGRRLTPHTGHWTITYTTPDGKLVAGGPRRVVDWYDTLALATEGGRPTLHRTQVLLAPDGTPLERIDNWADPATLAPLRTDNWYAAGTSSTRRYEGSHVTGWDPDSTAPEGRRAVDVTLGEPVFDFFGGLYDVLVAALPLRDGYRVRIPADLPPPEAPAGLEWVTLTVAGTEMIASSNAWRVETSPSRIGRFVFWISQGDGRMLRMWYVGPRGGKQIWDVGIA